MGFIDKLHNILTLTIKLINWLGDYLNKHTLLSGILGSLIAAGIISLIFKKNKNIFKEYRGKQEYKKKLISSIKKNEIDLEIILVIKKKLFDGKKLSKREKEYFGYTGESNKNDFQLGLMRKYFRIDLIKGVEDYWNREKNRYKIIRNEINNKILTKNYPINVTNANENDDPKEDSKSLKERIIELSEGCNPHFILIGEGGMGKTYSLKFIVKDFVEEDNAENSQYIPIFISLEKLTEEIKNISVDEIYGYIFNNFLPRLKRIICDEDLIEFIKICDSTKILLMFDGYNEISAKRQDSINQAIKIISLNKNVQIIITSRKDLDSTTILDNFTRLRLDYISKENIIDEIVKLSIKEEVKKEIKNEIYNDKHKRIRKILGNPMLLVLFCEAYGKNRIIDEKMKTSKITMSSIIGQFIETYRSSGFLDKNNIYQNEQIYLNILNYFIIPYIAYQMEKDGRINNVDNKKFIGYLNEAVKQYYINYEKLKEVYYNKTLFNKDIDKDVLLKIIDGHKLPYLSMERDSVNEEQTFNKYSFTHQHFRDYFAAKYCIYKIHSSWYFSNFTSIINNLMEVFNDVACSTPVKVFIGEISNLNSFKPKIKNDGYWDVENEFYQRPEFGYVLKILQKPNEIKWKTKECAWVTRGIVDILIEAWGNELSGCDLSQLNLSETEFNSILCSRGTYNNILSTRFDRSIVEEKCFLADGHGSAVGYLLKFSNGAKNYIISFATESIILFNADNFRRIKKFNFSIDSKSSTTNRKKMNRRIESACIIQNNRFVVTADLLGNLVFWLLDISDSDVILENVYQEDLGLPDSQGNLAFRPISKLLKISENELYLSYRDGTVFSYFVHLSDIDKNKLIVNNKIILKVPNELQNELISFPITVDNSNSILYYACGLNVFMILINQQSKQFVVLDEETINKYYEEKSYTIIENKGRISLLEFNNSDDSEYLVFSITDKTKTILFKFDIENKGLTEIGEPFMDSNPYRNENNLTVNSITFSEDRKNTALLATTDSGRIYEYKYQTKDGISCFIENTIYNKDQQQKNQMSIMSACYYVDDKVKDEPKVYVISASKDRSVKIWNKKNNWVEVTFDGYYDGLRKICKPDNISNILYIASYDTSVQELRKSRGENSDFKCYRVFRGHSDWVWDVVYWEIKINNKYLKKLLASCSDKTIIIWDLDKGEEIQKIEKHSAKVECMCFHEKIGLLSVGGDGKIFLHRFDKNGNCTNNSKEFELYKIVGGKRETITSNLFKNRIVSIQANKDGDRILIGGAEIEKKNKKDTTTRMVECDENGQIIKDVEWLDGWFRDVKFSNAIFLGKEWVLASGLISKRGEKKYFESLLFEYTKNDETFGKPKYILIGHSGFVNRACFSPDSNDDKLIVFSASEDNSINVYEINKDNDKDKKEIEIKSSYTVILPDQVFDVVVDDEYVYAVCLDGGLYRFKYKDLKSETQPIKLLYDDAVYSNKCKLWVPQCDFSGCVLPQEFRKTLTQYGCKL